MRFFFKLSVFYFILLSLIIGVTLYDANQEANAGHNQEASADHEQEDQIEAEQEINNLLNMDTIAEVVENDRYK